MSGIEAAFFGALGRDAESKTSKAGKAYLRLNVRVGDGDGVQWVSVMAFDQSAIDAADKLLKGARVYVEGSLSVTAKQARSVSAMSASAAGDGPGQAARCWYPSQRKSATTTTS